MKLLLISMLALVACVAHADKPLAGQAGEATASRFVPLGYILTWHDEFNGDSLDEELWSYRSEGRSSDGSDCSILSRDAVSLDGKGNLVLSTIEHDGQLLTGMVGTEHKFEVAYGYFEARIQFQREQGHHGAFWLKSRHFHKHPGNPKVAGVEIDIAEYFGDGRSDGGFAANVYWNDSEGSTKRATLERGAAGAVTDGGLADGQDLSDDYHVFSLEWTPEEYIFRADGHIVYRTRQAVSHREHPIILSLLSHAWEEPRLDRARLQDSMRVDYVRVYQRHDSIAARRR